MKKQPIILRIICGLLITAYAHLAFASDSGEPRRSRAAAAGAPASSRSSSPESAGGAAAASDKHAVQQIQSTGASLSHEEIDRIHCLALTKIADPKKKSGFSLELFENFMTDPIVAAVVGSGNPYEDVRDEPSEEAKAWLQNFDGKVVDVLYSDKTQVSLRHYDISDLTGDGYLEARGHLACFVRQANLRTEVVVIQDSKERSKRGSGEELNGKFVVPCVLTIGPNEHVRIEMGKQDCVLSPLTLDKAKIRAKRPESGLQFGSPLTYKQMETYLKGDSPECKRRVDVLIRCMSIAERARVSIAGLLTQIADEVDQSLAAKRGGKALMECFETAIKSQDYKAFFAKYSTDAARFVVMLYSSMKKYDETVAVPSDGSQDGFEPGTSVASGAVGGSVSRRTGSKVIKALRARRPSTGDRGPSRFVRPAPSSTPALALSKPRGKKTSTSSLSSQPESASAIEGRQASLKPARSKKGSVAPISTPAPVPVTASTQTRLKFPKEKKATSTLESSPAPAAAETTSESEVKQEGQGRDRGRR